MHFRSVTLVNYQSHQRSHLELGPLTVIVGSSSSGKSAVVRALQLVAQNDRGVKYVRHGTKQARVSVELESSAGGPPTLVTVTRGKGVSEYELSLPGAEEPTVFTKCSTTVPDALVEVLGVGDPSLWVAGQFDRPYLLDETGSAVAQVLGRLTNVTMIYAAVRECNRRASERRRQHKEKTVELATARSQLGVYATLPARLAAGREAEAGVDRVQALFDRQLRLAEQLRAADDAQSRSKRALALVRTVPPTERLDELAGRRSRLADRLQETASVSQRLASVTAVLRQVPDVGEIEPLVTQRARLGVAVDTVLGAGTKLTQLTEESTRASLAVGAAKTRFAKALSSAGSCPLCGASADSARIERVV